jgi:transposase-like protein
MITELRSIGDIYTKMPSSDDARRFLEYLMWSDGRVCPHCGGLRSTGLNGVAHRSGLYQCNECRSQFTITTKTPMHATKLDLRVWIAAIYTVLNSSKGISSVVLARMIGVSQKCAWKIGHAIREMMREDYGTRPMLAGIVEVDETSVGGAPKYKKGVKKSVVRARRRLL